MENKQLQSICNHWFWLQIQKCIHGRGIDFFLCSHKSFSIARPDVFYCSGSWHAFWNTISMPSRYAFVHYIVDYTDGYIIWSSYFDSMLFMFIPMLFMFIPFIDALNCSGLCAYTVPIKIIGIIFAYIGLYTESFKFFAMQKVCTARMTTTC